MGAFSKFQPSFRAETALPPLPRVTTMKTATLFINTVEEFDLLEDAMLTAERDVAKKLNIKPCTLRNERLQGAISFIKIRSRYFYTDEQIEEYLRSKTIHLKPPEPVLAQPVNYPDRPSIRTPPIPPARTQSSAEKEALKEAALRSARELFVRRPRGVRWRKKSSNSPGE
jgi:hypothetical protein